MQPPADPPVMWFFLVVAIIALAGLCGLYWTVSAIVHQSHKLIETNRILALGYANPNAALRLVARDQANEKDAKTKAALNQIRLAQTLNERTLAQQNVAARGKPPREFPSLKYHNPVDDDIVKPEESTEGSKK